MAGLFRKEAMENFSTSGDVFVPARAINIRLNTVIGILAVFSILFLFWLFEGTIQESLSVDCILWNTRSNDNVYSFTDGKASKVLVNEGTYIKSGDIIAIVPNETILAEIEAAKSAGANAAQLQTLYDKYSKASMIRSATDGIVSYIIAENTYITPDTLIATIVPYDPLGNNKTLVAYIPSEKSGLIKGGMEAQVTPNFVSRSNAGYINGYISAIGDLPIKGYNIKERSPELFTSDIDEAQSYIRVEITLLPDSTAASNLSWSRSDSGSIDITMGTVCTADIIVDETSPFKWLF